MLQFYDADAWLCMSETKGRRYDYIEYEDKTVLGQKNGQCSQFVKLISETISPF